MSPTSASGRAPRGRASARAGWTSSTTPAPASSSSPSTCPTSATRTRWRPRPGSPTPSRTRPTRTGRRTPPATARPEHHAGHLLGLRDRRRADPERGRQQGPPVLRGPGRPDDVQHLPDRRRAPGERAAPPGVSRQEGGSTAEAYLTWDDANLYLSFTDGPFIRDPGNGEPPDLYVAVDNDPVVGGDPQSGDGLTSQPPTGSPNSADVPRSPA